MHWQSGTTMQRSDDSHVLDQGAQRYGKHLCGHKSEEREQNELLNATGLWGARRRKGGNYQSLGTGSDFQSKCGKTCYFTEYGNQADDNTMMASRRMVLST